MKKYFALFLNFFLNLNLILNLYSCNTTEPPSNQTLTLKLEDVSCTEAWIQLTSNNLQLPAAINLLKNNSVSQIYNLNTKDSLLYIDSLLPNQNYSFQVSSIEYPVSPGGTGSISSNKLTVTTMDTTSHNFTWQTFTFGEAGAGSSVLYDVAIINENDIWAVGEIYMNDSLGRPDPNSYNAVHWNGQRWELKKIGGIGGWACHTVFAFSENDIWFEGNIHWDGSKYTVHMNGWPLMPNGDGWQVNKMWGSSNDLYAVGNNGNIAHWAGVKWRKIESGTDLPINDILGSMNLNDGRQNIYCIASNKYQLVDKKFLKISADKVLEQSNEGLPWSISSLWFNSKYKIYIVGDGIFVKDWAIGNIWDNITNRITSFYTHSIRGKGLNDIVVSGSSGELIHYNGWSWHSYRGNELPIFYGNYYSTTISVNVICAVGEASLNSNKAIISLGFR